MVFGSLWGWAQAAQPRSVGEDDHGEVPDFGYGDEMDFGGPDSDDEDGDAPLDDLGQALGLS